MVIQWMQRMREAGLTQAQAEAIAAFPEERLVTRDYLDGQLEVTRDYLDARLEVTRDYLEARLDALKNQVTSDLTWRLLGIVSLAIAVVALIDKFVRP